MKAILILLAIVYLVYFSTANIVPLQPVTKSVYTRQFGTPPSATVITTPNNGTNVTRSGQCIPCGVGQSICCYENEVCCFNVNNGTRRAVSCSQSAGGCCADGSSCGAGQSCCGNGCAPSGTQCCGGLGYCPRGFSCSQQGAQYGAFDNYWRNGDNVNGGSGGFGDNNSNGGLGDEDNSSLYRDGIYQGPIVCASGSTLQSTLFSLLRMLF
eukprot:TRINITY_DN19060_c0_g1_i1.p1 TRINITY_DN19060_c0_g1~~TRINITY_DN19060_c0_g1_i1.p1  ORF type:complete len:211 (-),score=45.05 TRINITY_DN19060_c0_g1_i1:128-760(-)